MIDVVPQRRVVRRFRGIGRGLCRRCRGRSNCDELLPNPADLVVLGLDVEEAGICGRIDKGETRSRSEAVNYRACGRGISTKIHIPIAGTFLRRKGPRTTEPN
jgi:hypothetical protein